MRLIFFACLLAAVIVEFLAYRLWPVGLYSLIVVGPLGALGLWDALQTRRAVLRNFPLLGHFRYMFEFIRPEINQYFVESDTDGRPFSRELRSIVYQRAKNTLDTLPFGTKHSVYAPGYEWLNHSLAPVHVDPSSLRITIGGPACRAPYDASIFNISAMSFGALSKNAILALNGGAKKGRFAHNTGEGGVSPYHLQPGGDLIWQIGTGYFGCRDDEGRFSPSLFEKTARQPTIKMIELKLSQGAKPGHGGILPAAKLTEELAQIRKVPLGHDVVSPPAHSSFDSPKGLCRFIAQLRELSGGKPVGFKLCLGKRRQFLSVVKAMKATGITPDYVAVDGGEGGTGAAPLEFTNALGTPLTEAVIFVHNALMGFGLRDQVRVIAAGRAVTARDIIRLCAIGADGVYAARAFMFALGCIQALRCNSNHCPVGVATQRPWLVAGLHVTHKTERVYQYHHHTMKAAAELMGAMGVPHPADLRPWHVMRRTSPTEVRHYAEMFEFLEEGALLQDPLPPSFARAMQNASADTFD